MVEIGGVQLEHWKTEQTGEIIHVYSDPDSKCTFLLYPYHPNVIYALFV